MTTANAARRQADIFTVAAHERVRKIHQSMAGIRSTALDRVSHAAPTSAPVRMAANKPRPRTRTAIAATDSDVQRASGSRDSESIQLVGNAPTTTLLTAANRQLPANRSTSANTASARSALDTDEIKNREWTTWRLSVCASAAMSSGYPGFAL